ncbi:MAG: hypothetical protein HKO53_11820, partial [Gemmatimonadetes bacterium]|nr:hypothetical protein [Gemmatimonadota bacterium]
MVRSRRPILLIALVVWGCAPPSIDPASTGGVLLPETQGLAYLGGDSFSVSPGEEWLLYSLKPRPDSVPPPEDPATSLIETLGAYRLYDLEEGVSRPVSVSEAVRTEIDDGAYWLARGGCWVATEGGPVVALLN